MSKSGVLDDVADGRYVCLGGPGTSVDLGVQVQTGEISRLAPTMVRFNTETAEVTKPIR